jgi:hypothetical protein
MSGKIGSEQWMTVRVPLPGGTGTLTEHDDVVDPIVLYTAACVSGTRTASNTAMQAMPASAHIAGENIRARREGVCTSGVLHKARTQTPTACLPGVPPVCEMRVLAIVVAFCALFTVCTATNTQVTRCVTEKLYLEQSTRIGTLYAAFMTSSSEQCRDAAMRITCAASAMIHYSITEEQFMCTLNCAGYITSICPDVLRLSPSCPAVSPTECTSKLRQIALTLLN